MNINPILSSSIVELVYRLPVVCVTFCLFASLWLTFFPHETKLCSRCATFRTSLRSTAHRAQSSIHDGRSVVYRHDADTPVKLRRPTRIAGQDGVLEESSYKDDPCLQCQQLVLNPQQFRTLIIQKAIICLKLIEFLTFAVDEVTEMFGDMTWLRLLFGIALIRNRMEHLNDLRRIMGYGKADWWRISSHGTVVDSLLLATWLWFAARGAWKLQMHWH